VELRLPSEAGEKQFHEMLMELDTADEIQHHGMFAGAARDFERYVKLLRTLRAQSDEDHDVYPIDCYFIYSHSRLVGEVRIRHQLPPEIENLGGHITLYVRPSARLRKIGSEALYHAINLAKERGLRVLLLAALSSNLGACGVMKNNDGIRIGDIDSPAGIFQRYRYFT
jgi:predicted acetyltransferase